MNNMKQIFFVLTLSVFMYACSSADGNYPGSEYVPDMGHSLAVEANAYDYYEYNTWNKESTIPLWELVKVPGQPVAGTIPRGYAGEALGAEGDLDVVLGNDQIGGIRITPNGSVPYYYEDSDSSRASASLNAHNPYPITAKGLAKGKELYGFYCGLCHGEKADGLGFLYDSDTNKDAKYLAAPANLLDEKFWIRSNGDLYHTIMYGYNIMGSYADKLGYEERWQVIHYIRSLQAKAAKATYNEEENTFNAAHGTPQALMQMHEEEVMHEEVIHEETHVEGEHHTDSHQ